MVTTCGIYLYDTENKKILICHPTHARWNQWSIPKGLKETDGESLWEVAKRELFEETYIDEKVLHKLKVVQLPPVKYQKQNKILESFLIITDTDLEDHVFKSDNIPGKTFAEVDKWKWIKLDEADNWLHESQQKNIDIIKKQIGQES